MASHILAPVDNLSGIVIRGQGRRNDGYCSSSVGCIFRTMTSSSPIQELIGNRCHELGLTAPDVVRRTGYQNLVRGLRRLQALRNGDLETTKGLIAQLPEGLDLPPEAITQAVEETRREIEVRRDEAYRASFKPHAIVITERKIPTQIVFAHDGWTS